ncbi:MAG: hypothetical protein IPK75_18255 [Acidobacteria bacterium]|nr:hypothetical protein [Acidobacteriota bacterium]
MNNYAIVLIAIIGGTLAALLMIPISTAQQPGSVTVTNTVTAIAGPITCTLSNPAPPAFSMTCSAPGGATLKQDATPAVGATSGIVGSFNVGADAVTWIVKQETAGAVTWQVGANGVMKAGSF